jgi:peptide/nickel transport system substrate-binding protein
MRKIYRWLPFVLTVILLVTSTSVSTKAQGDKGGFILDATFGKGPETFNPIFCNDQTCATDIARMMPSIALQDPEDLVYKPGVQGSLAKDWKRSDDGLTWTITLRNDWKWSDGQPITSKDILYAYKAQINEAVESPNIYIKEDIEDVQAPDDYTLVVKLKRPECTSAFQKIDSIGGTGGIAPAHVLPTDPTKLKDAEFNLKPTVSAGQYKFDEFRTGEQTRFLSDQSFPDKKGPKIQHDGYIEKVVENQTVLVQQFLAGELNVILEPPVARRKDIFDAEKKGEVKTFSAPGTLWDHIVLNLADPKNPKDALDKDGKPVDQGHHPVLGDVRVRKAFAMGINLDEIIKGAVFGYGQRMNSLLTPGNIFYNKDLKPIPFDQEAAKKLLEEAGWVPGPDGIRVAKGAKYAPDGTKLSISLIVIQGNVRRTAVATVIKDQLSRIGFNIDIQPMDFNVMIDRMRAQDFDAAVAARGSAYDDSIDWTFLFDPATDKVGAEGNQGSYINPELTALMKQASAVPGCDPKKAKELYDKIQQTLQDDLPYIFLYAQDYMYAWRTNIENVKPFKLSVGYTDQWKVNAK